MKSFDFSAITRVFFGNGGLRRLPEIALITRENNVAPHPGDDDVNTAVVSRADVVQMHRDSL